MLHEDEEELLPQQYEADRRTSSHVHALLATLQRPVPPPMTTGESVSGVLRKERRAARGYKDVHYAIRDGLTLVYFADGAGPGAKPKGALQLCWVSAVRVAQLELEDLASRTRSHFAAYRLMFFTQDRIYSLMAGKNETIDLFYHALRKTLKEALGDNFEERDAAAKELLPLLETHYVSEMERAAQVLSLLTDSTLVAQPGRTKKQGYLTYKTYGGKSESVKGRTLKKTEWKKLYFTLRAQTLFYKFPSRDQTPDDVTRSGFISLRYAIIEMAVHPKKKDPASMVYEFHIKTPFKSYRLRAKHDEALREWIEAIETAQGKRKPMKSATGAAARTNGVLSDLLGSTSPSSRRNKGTYSALDGEAAAAAAAAPAEPLLAAAAPVPGSSPSAAAAGVFDTPPPSYSKPRLEWTDPITHKKKSQKLNGGRTLIGRGHQAAIRLKGDKQVSRMHAAVDTTTKPTTYCVFIDLGSQHGSKLNDANAVKSYLRPGDQITVGGTTLVFLTK